MNILGDLWTEVGGGTPLPAVRLTGTEPGLPSSFRVGALAQASIAAAALAARELGRERGGTVCDLEVDLRAAAVEFRSERYLRLDGAAPPDPWDALAGLYRCADGWLRLHTNFPHHRAGIVRLLGCADERAAVAAALLGWPAEAFEQAAAEAGMCAAALRSYAQWDAHPQAAAVAAEPLVRTSLLGSAPPGPPAPVDDAPPRPLPPSDAAPRPPSAGPTRPLPPLAPGCAPLAGLRVLDLSRVLAGPVAGRTLAAYGADVLRVHAAHLPAIFAADADTGRGKRSAYLDLREPAGREALRALVREADVLIQAYRPGALAALGFGAEALAALRPGLVVASLSAYGTQGPWAGRRGFDSLVQTAAGFNLAEAEAVGSATPRALPAQALDHASGYLLACGAIQALRRRAVDGASRHVQVSLARTALWLRSLGRLEHGLAAPDPGYDDVSDLLEELDTGYGRMTAVRHAARFEPAPLGVPRGASPLGRDAARWLA